MPNIIYHLGSSWATHMVGDLHVETSMNELDVLMAGDVHRGAQLACREGLVQSKVFRGLSKV